MHSSKVAGLSLKSFLVYKFVYQQSVYACEYEVDHEADGKVVFEGFHNLIDHLLGDANSTRTGNGFVHLL